MIRSNQRKLTLSGWLKDNNIRNYTSILKLQNFLIFYEMFSYINHDVSDFYSLKKYKRGQIFGNVWNDYISNKDEFEKRIKETYNENKECINKNRAEISNFLVTILNDTEISNLFNRLNWDFVNNPKFTKNDIELIKRLEKLYPLEEIKNYNILHINNYSFLLNKNNSKKLTEKHINVLIEITETKPCLLNPIYVDICKDGVLLVE